MKRHNIIKKIIANFLRLIFIELVNQIIKIYVQFLIIVLLIIIKKLIINSSKKFQKKQIINYIKLEVLERYLMIKIIGKN